MRRQPVAEPEPEPRTVRESVGAYALTYIDDDGKKQTTTTPYEAADVTACGALRLGKAWSDGTPTGAFVILAPGQWARVDWISSR